MAQFIERQVGAVGWRSRRAMVMVAMGVLSAFAWTAFMSKGEASDSVKRRPLRVTLSPEVSEGDVGLPIYPLSIRVTSSRGIGPPLKVGIWGGGTGFGIAVVKLQSTEPATQIVRFYRAALGQYGPVVVCGTSPPVAELSRKDPRGLDCDADHPSAGGIVLKSGTKARQHIVAIEPGIDRQSITLAYVENLGGQ